MEKFIDATKRGGKGRFANHSCNPNCYVAKWSVGKHVRMGIFASRNIKKDEELTFNYNVDRYGYGNSIHAAGTTSNRFLAMKHNHVTVAKQNALVSSVGRHRLIWQLWTIYTSMVRSSLL